MRFGEHAQLRGWITESNVDRALDLQASGAERLGTLLVRMGLLSRRQRLEILALMSGMPFVERLPARFVAHEDPWGFFQLSWVKASWISLHRSNSEGFNP